MQAIQTFPANYTNSEDLLKLQAIFNELYQKWGQETSGLSSISKKMTNLNYLKIIALGKIVVPFILESLQTNPDHWFLALKALTDEDPTQPGDNFEQAVEAWLNWGKQKSFIC